MTARHLQPVREALLNPVDAPGDEFDPRVDDRGGDGDDRFTRPPHVMPAGCPVTPVGTEDGIYYFLTALGELRALPCDKIANKHIVGMFAPEAQFLYDAWPRKTLKKTKDSEGNEREEWIVTGWRNDDVAMLLMNVAADEGVWSAREKVRGRGAWVGDDGGLILHCGNHVMIGGRWLKPGMHDKLVYPTAPPTPKPSGASTMTAAQVCPVLVGQLRARGIEIADDATPALALLELFKTWNWERPLIDPILLIGWIGAAMIGGALDYRPLAWITGGAATGKSALQKILGWLFDSGILQSPDASEAAVRQVLGQQSLPVAIDEAEASADNRKIQALVKLARLAATSQGNILRGGQDHKGHEFQATSCFLFSSIIVPPLPPQDRSRLAMLELGALPPGARAPMYDKREIAAIGAWLRKRLVDSWPIWPDVLGAYYDAIVDMGGQGGRAADQFGTLRAAAHVLLDAGMPDDEDVSLWGMMLGAKQLAETSGAMNDGELCIQHLVGMPVALDTRGQQRIVSEWLLQASEPVEPGLPLELQSETRGRRDAAQKALGRIGIRIVTGTKRTREAGDDKPQPIPGRDYVAIAVKHQGLAKLFENSDWVDGGWGQSLGRVDGAVKGETQRILGINTKCTFVPVDAMVQRDGDGDVVARVGEMAE